MSFAESLTRPREWHAAANTNHADKNARSALKTESELGIGLQNLVRELGRANKHSEESGGAAKGTLGSIGRIEEQLVFMARGCDYFIVTP